MLHGTDISAFQSTTVPAGDFVIIKATQGTGYTNSKLAAQLADARRKGMLVGFYHFPEFGNDPLADARHFCSVVAPLLRPGDKVILDHEAGSPPSATHAAAWGMKFLPYTETHCRRRPWVYSNISWASGGYCAGMGVYPYWCADPSSPAGKPRVRGPFKSWIAHQYSSAGGIDRDVFNGTRADWLGSPTPTPTPTPTPLEEDEMLTRDLKPGLGEKTGCPFDAGKFTKALFFADNGFKDGKNVVATQPVTVRYALLRVDGTWQTGTVKVGRADTDKASTVQKVAFTDAKNTVAISVTRVDGDGTEPVTFTVA